MVSLVSGDFSNFLPSSSRTLCLWLDTRVFHNKEISHISVRLSDRSEVTRHKINFAKNCPQLDLNPQLLDHHSHAMPTKLGRILLEISEVSFLLFHAPLHMLDFVSHPQSNSDLAQLAEHETDDLEVVSSNPTGGNFWWNLFCSV